MEVDKVKLDGLVRRIRAENGKILELLEAVDALLNQEATPGQIARQLIDGFIAGWGTIYKGRTYHVPNWPAAMAGMKKLLKDMDVLEVKRRQVRYLESREGYYVDAGHPLPLFFASINKWGTAPERGLLDGAGAKYRGVTEGDDDAGDGKGPAF